MRSIQRLSVAAIAALLASVPTTALAARCGGVERWAVKVASDEGASEIDTSRITDLTVAQLNKIEEPNDLPKDEDTRHSAEKSVLRVVGKLAEYRNEADKDYHLIVTDDTLKFTPGGKKTKPTGTSFIAEIPDPRCVPGKRGNLDSRSHFETGLREVRKAFDEGPATEIGPKKDLGGISVRITGLAFFDRPHGQTGRAKNNLEIHPILKIEFLDEEEAIQPAAAAPDVPAAVDLIEGGEFEEQIEAWVTSDPDVVQPRPYPDAIQYRGRGRAELGGLGVAGRNFMYQKVDIPKDAKSVELRFRMRVRTEEEEEDKRMLDTMRVQLRTAGGKPIKTLFTLSNRDATPRWKAYSADLSAFRGRTVQVYFEGKEDRALATFFWVDAVKVIASK